METRPKVDDVAPLRPLRAADAEPFLAAVRKEHSRFIDALAQAGSLLGRDSKQLEHAHALQVQLTRQLLDAQRSILQLRAETDRDLDLIGTAPGKPTTDATIAFAEAGVTQRQQLTAVLDEWWVEELELRRAVLNEARSAVEAYLARLTEDDGIELPVLPTAATSVLAQLETADTAQLQSLLDGLILALAPTPRQVPPVTATPISSPNDLHFVEFWESTPAAVTPLASAPSSSRRGWRLVPPAVYPVAAVASLLTVAMAWIG